MAAVAGITAALVAVCFVGAGAAALRTLGHGRVGALLVVVGVLWTLAKFLPAGGPRALLAGAWAATLAHLVLAFPAGRLAGPAARAAVLVAYLSAAVVGLLGFAGASAALIRGVSIPAAVFSAAAVIGVQAARWRTSSVARRRTLNPFFAAGVVVVAMFLTIKPAMIGGVAAPPLTPLVQMALAAVPLAYLASLLRRRMDRGGVARLVVRLTGEPGPVAVERALAEVLHDPGLRVGYWMPESGRYADVNGHEVAAPADGRVTTRIDRDGAPLALLVHDPSVAEDPGLVEAACAAAGLAVSNGRLTADLRTRLRQLAESRGQVLRAAEAERRRLERDLHDGVQQRLLSIPVTLARAELALPRGPDRAGALIDEARSTSLSVLAELRALSQGIHPPALTEHGLDGAVRELAAMTPIPVRLSVRVPDSLPMETETVAYYVVAEALANVTKHADARSASVRIAKPGGCVTVEVADDGRGGADPARGSGLRGLADRVSASGGVLRVESPAGHGTRVAAEWPCGS